MKLSTLVVSSSQNNIKISMEDKMQNKESNIRLLLLGRAVSLFGSTVYLIVLPLYILNLTNNLII